MHGFHRFRDLFHDAVEMFFGKFGRPKFYCQVDIKCPIFMRYLLRTIISCGYNVWV